MYQVEPAKRKYHQTQDFQGIVRHKRGPAFLFPSFLVSGFLGLELEDEWENPLNNRCMQMKSN